MQSTKISYNNSFPKVRLRRNRTHSWLRNIVSETKLSVDDLICPIFIRDQKDEKDIPSIPGVQRHNLSELIDYVGQLRELKIPAIHLFPYFNKEDRLDNVVSMLTPDNMLCRAIEELKRQIPGIGIISDVALDCYSTHGQDGIVVDGKIDNDKTLEVISHYAQVQAAAGVDIIAPSEMMDGRIGAIREALDSHGHNDVGILSYAAKYASGFYGPFRDAVGSKNCLGQADKKTYQMDPRNAEEAMREIALDIEEGADWIMVKPGLLYLDILKMAKEQFKIPTFAFHVSGELAMLKAAAKNGWLDYNQCLIETMYAFKRAGADGILTYAAAEVATLLKEGHE